ERERRQAEARQQQIECTGMLERYLARDVATRPEHDERGAECRRRGQNRRLRRPHRERTRQCRRMRPVHENSTERMALDATVAMRHVAINWLSCKLLLRSQQ